VKAQLTILDSAKAAAILLTLCFLGAATVGYATAHGPWAFSDSVAYIVSAQNLAHGKGFGLIQASGDFTPLVHYPPLYPLILSVAVLCKIDALTAARWLNVLLFGSLVWMVGVFTYRHTRSAWVCFTSLSVILSCPTLVYVYCGAMSEPLFIVLVMASLSALTAGLACGRRHKLVLAGFLAGLATMTRYTGLAALGTGLIAVVVLGGARPRQRATDAARFLLGGLAPVTVWILGASRMQGASPIRQLTVPITDIWEASRPLRADLADTLWRLLPYSPHLWRPPYWLVHLAWITTLVSILAVGAVTMQKSRRVRESEGMHGYDPGRLAVLLSCFVLVYIGVLSLAYLFTTPTPDVNERMLSPALIPGWLSGLSAIQAVVHCRPRLGFLRVVATAVVAGSVLYTAPVAGRTIQDLHAEGAGYTSAAWSGSRTVEAARRFDPAVPLITNESAAILLLTGRPAYDIPQMLESMPRPSFDRFGDDRTDSTEEVFRDRGAALIVFDSALDQLRRLYGDDASLRLADLTLGLDVFARYPDGTIYFYP
jgi:hypothetical protein